jgi:acyl carrier protein
MIKIYEILAESLEIDISKVEPAFIYRNHESWDSLAALTFITAIEDEFGLVLGDTELQSAITAQDLANLVVSRLAKK